MQVVFRWTERDYARWRRETAERERVLVSGEPAPEPVVEDALDERESDERESEGQVRQRQTKALIAKWGALYERPLAETILPLLDRWQELDRTGTARDKQSFLEPLIERVRRTPNKHRGELVFLLVVLEPIRASVTAELRRLSVGLGPSGPAPDWHRREEVRRLAELERERIDDVTRYALLDAIERYSNPVKLFPWLRNALAYRALDFLRHELAQGTSKGIYRDEADALQLALHALDDIEAPTFTTRRRPRRGLWEMRELFGRRTSSPSTARCAA